MIVDTSEVVIPATSLGNAYDQALPNTSTKSLDAVDSDQESPLVLPPMSPGAVFSVTLVKTEEGFGFNIVGGKDNQHLPGNDWIFISMLKANGPAAKDGRIQEGDRVISINGVELDEMNHEEAVDEFRRVPIGGKATLVIESQADLKLVSEAHLEPQVLNGSLDTPSSYEGLLAGIGEDSRRIDVRSILSRRSNRSPDDVPKTPRKPFSIIDPRNNSLFTEMLYVSIGLAVIGGTAFVVYRWWNRGRSH